MKAASELDEDRSYKTNFIILYRMLYNHKLSTEERNLVDEEQKKDCQLSSDGRSDQSRFEYCSNYSCGSSDGMCGKTDQFVPQRYQLSKET